MDLPKADKSCVQPTGPGAAPGIVFLVFVCVAFVCFFRLGTMPITETDEGFAGTRADSFERHGGWILSYDDVNDDQPQFRKPPLLYWLVAVLFKVVGHTTWAVRLPTAAAGFLTAWLLFRLARGALGDRVALCAVLLICTVPFFVLHIRTAMLEVPLIAALFAGLAAVRLLPETWWRPVAVGLCGGAALMIKGPGGVLVVVVPVLFGLVHQRFRPRAWAEALIALVVALVLPALWYLAIPPGQRGRVIGELLIGESAKRGRASAGAWLRLPIGGHALVEMLRWQLPAAACGMLLALGRSRRNRDLAQWLGVGLAVTVPLLWAYAAMVLGYPRYLLMAVPFLLSFSAYFALEATASRAAGLLLVPFAAVSVALDATDPWRWLPAAAAMVAYASVWTGWAPGHPQRRLSAGCIFLAAIAAASWLSPATLSKDLSPPFRSRPELVPLVRQAASLIPQNEKLIVEKGITAHTILFYGRRAIRTHDFWLFNEITGHEVRYAIVQDDPLVGIPGIRQEEVGRSGTWRLVRLIVDMGDRPPGGILLVPDAQQASTANTLGLFGVGFESFSRGFILKSVPDYIEVEVPASLQSCRVLLPSGAPRTAAAAAGAMTVKEGEAIEVVFPSPRSVIGVEIIPANRQDVLSGWIIEVANDGAWSEVKRIDGPFEEFMIVEGTQVLMVSRRAARVRFAPVTAGRLKLVRTAAEPIAVGKVRVLEERPGSPERIRDGGKLP